MNHFETSTVVGGQGEIHLAAVPFTPGTEVEVVVSPKIPGETHTPTKDDEGLNAARGQMRELFARLHGRNTEPVGPLNREEIYDRQVLR